MNGSAPGEQAQRKLLTLLFADLSGYTELAQQHDPEYVDAVVSPLLTELGKIAEQHGAEVRPPQGDGFLAVFGAAQTHDDDPARAVQAARAMRSYIAARAARDRRTLGLHVGVASGEVLVRGSVEHGSLTGTAVNLAARLNDQASRGEVLVDDLCARLCRVTEWFGEARLFDLQGFTEPVRARLLLEAPAEPTEGWTAPPVGRAAELEALTRLWREVRLTGRSRVVGLTGEAGAGKTTVVTAWCAENPAVVTLVGGCRGYGHTLPLGPLVEAVLALGDGDLRALGARLATTRATAVIDRLAALLAPRTMEGGQAGREDDRALVVLLRDLLVELARQQPMVLVLEDLHDSGRDLLVALDELVTDPLPAPVLIIATSPHRHSSSLAVLGRREW